MQVTVVGTGTIGSTVAYNLATGGVSVRCTDTEGDKHRGHATDISHGLAHAGHPLGPGCHGGEIRAVPPETGPRADTDCIVITASAPRPSGADRRGGRVAWLSDNLELAGELGGWLRSAPPRPVVVVTNPVDAVTYELYRQSQWPAHCFVGYSLSETARTAHVLADEYNSAPAAVDCPVLGEHGEQMVPVFSRATVAGERLHLDETKKREILDRVRAAPYTVMEQRGAGESSRWVTGRGVALLVRGLLAGSGTEPVGLSTPLDAVYGYEDVALSVPVVLGADGVTEIVEWELSPWERARMDDAYRAVETQIPD